MSGKISIALATYNGERFLEEQLQSLATQTRPPDELVVSDDDSSDSTLGLLRAFAATAPFSVKLLPATARLGYAGNFNRALSATSGDLVFLCDQDDVWFPDKLQVMAEQATAQPDAMVLMNDVSIVDSSLEGGVTKLQQFASSRISLDRYVMGAAAAVRKEFLAAVLPIPAGYPAHDDWIIKFAIWLNRRHLYKVPLQHYRMHGSNTSRFRVNSTQRVSPLSVARSRVEGLLRGRSLEIEPSHLTLLTHELRGAERAVEQAEGRLSDEFALLSQRLQGKRAVLSRRLELRQRSHTRRLSEISRMMLDGSYQQFSGLKSVLADLVSPINNTEVQAEDRVGQVDRSK